MSADHSLMRPFLRELLASAPAQLKLWPEDPTQKRMAQVEAAERALGVRFPRALREFHMLCEGGYAQGYEFFCVLTDVALDGWPGVVPMTLSERAAGYLPPLAVYILRSNESSYCIDCSGVRDNDEPPVLVRDAGESAWRPATGNLYEFLKLVATDRLWL